MVATPMAVTTDGAWHGAVPAGWSLKQLKWAVTFQRGHDLPTEDRQEGPFPVVTGGGITGWHNVAQAKEPGIVTGRYGTIGEFYLIGQDYWPLNTSLYSIDLHGNHAGFLRYMLEPLAPLFHINAAKSAVPGIDRSDIHTIPVAVPPLATQRAIADYLDRETARLDALVAAKERLLGLLAEKRRVLITCAVTRGLDPCTSLRDSGIAWLGEIPAHWELSRLKHFAAIYYGLSQPPDYVPSGIPFLRATNVKRGELTKDGLVFVDEGDLPDSRVVRLCTGDIIVVRSGAYTGDSAIVTEEWRGAVAGYDMVVRIQRRAVPEFVSRALLCQYILEAQIDPLRLRAAQPHLNAEELGDISFALPPIDEQRAIVTHIAAETAKLDALRVATERTIALLKERRAALIAAAVTGKLDVQGAERHLDVVAD